jgi:hypothetical protein
MSMRTIDEFMALFYPSPRQHLQVPFDNFHTTHVFQSHENDYWRGRKLLGSTKAASCYWHPSFDSSRKILSVVILLSHQRPGVGILDLTKGRWSFLWWKIWKGADRAGRREVLGGIAKSWDVVVDDMLRVRDYSFLYERRDWISWHFITLARDWEVLGRWYVVLIVKGGIDIGSGNKYS